MTVLNLLETIKLAIEQTLDSLKIPKSERDVIIARIKNQKIYMNQKFPAYMNMYTRDFYVNRLTNKNIYFMLNVSTDFNRFFWN